MLQTKLTNDFLLCSLIIYFYNYRYGYLEILNIFMICLLININNLMTSYDCL